MAAPAGSSYNFGSLRVSVAISTAHRGFFDTRNWFTSTLKPSNVIWGPKFNMAAQTGSSYNWGWSRSSVWPASISKQVNVVNSVAKAKICDVFISAPIEQQRPSRGGYQLKLRYSYVEFQIGSIFRALPPDPMLQLKGRTGPNQPAK